MKYGHYHSPSGVKILKDVYGHHFSDEITTNYQIEILGDIVIEDENPRHLADRLFAMSKRLEQVARFLSKIGRSTSHRQGTK